MADARGGQEVDGEEKQHDWPTKLVAIHTSSDSHWKFVPGRDIAQDLHCTYLDYDDTRRSLAAANQGDLGEATYKVLARVSAAQLSFRRSALIVGPKPSQSRAYLEDLLCLADSYGVPLIVIELRGRCELEVSEDWVTSNNIPLLILPPDFPVEDLTTVHYRLRYRIKTFVEYFDHGGHGMSEDINLRHVTHRHPLLLNSSGNGDVAAADLYCSVCTGSITDLDYYSCSSCGFFLHKSCAELPQHTKSPIHSHFLRLVAVSSEKNGRRLFSYSCRNPDFRIKCLVCDLGVEQQPFYGCLLCPDLFAHYECIRSLRQIIEHPLHPHPLKMQTMEFPQLGPDFVCYACGGIANAICYSCEDCEFYLHLKCAHDLPSSVHHKCHKDHQLILSMPPKDETNEYYCEVCAERRHPDYWIYYCKGCEYEAHPHCVIEGIPPYTYVEEDGVNENEDGDEEEDDRHGKGEDHDDNEEGSGNPNFRKILRKLAVKNKEMKPWYDYI